ncbi:ATP-binding protein [Bacillus sp. REN3]|uniref:ATP-binding protein n=1 Tax=Bacillus sp. REN3 TaxID=2802440 RepID=UPI001AEE2CDA|nr:ATP-binding protein [Bacillus sp. REN3]
MRDIIEIQMNEDESIVVACDNSGAIGKKERDAVRVPYETVAYYSFRVAAMECLSAGAEPFAVTVQNFNGEDAWKLLLKGIHTGMDELGRKDLKITGSTESNFPLDQSALGITVLGKRKNSLGKRRITMHEQTDIAVIGSPLVGQELIEREGDIAPLSLFDQICRLEDVVIIPVGSKGILSELNNLFSEKNFVILNPVIDLRKSSGPSTCFIALYPRRMRPTMESIAGSFFHEIGCLE